MKRLAARKHLRGTAFDPFRFPEIRRIERELPAEYVEAIDEQLDHLSEDRLDTAVEIAQLPDLVRGYEDIKLRNVRAYRARLSELRGVAAP